MTHEQNNFGGRAENPVSDEQKVSNLLRDLNRVEAPKNFDFHLKARIANARPDDYRKPSLFPILKYAMPLGLFLAVGGGVLVSNSYNSWQAPTAVSDPGAAGLENVRTVPNEPNNVAVAASSPQVSPPDAGVNMGPGIEVAAKPGRPVIAAREVVDGPAAPQGGSRTMSVRPAPTPVVPPEFRSGNSNTSSNSSAPPKEMMPKEVPVRDALGVIGIEAELVGAKWKVKSVQANNIAGQMGVKAGDVIESIDGKVVDDKTVYKGGSFSVKSIRVRRGTAASDLTMPKPKEQ